MRNNGLKKSAELVTVWEPWRGQTMNPMQESKEWTFFSNLCKNKIKLIVKKYDDKILYSITISPNIFYNISSIGRGKLRYNFILQIK